MVMDGKEGIFWSATVSGLSPGHSIGFRPFTDGFGDMVRVGSASTYRRESDMSLGNIPGACFC